MKFMTYKELRDQLNKLSDAELDNHVQVLIEDEFFPVTEVKTSDEQNDVLDPGTHYLVVP